MKTEMMKVTGEEEKKDKEVKRLNKEGKAGKKKKDASEMYFQLN